MPECQFFFSPLFFKLNIPWPGLLQNPWPGILQNEWPGILRNHWQVLVQNSQFVYGASSKRNWRIKYW